MDFLPLPRFSCEKLAIWFAQVESVFTLNGISSDSDKYDYIVAHLPLEYSSVVEDIILNPPPESKYDHIKYEFIKRMSINRLKKEELGSEKPSVYLQRLRRMADQRVPIEIILNIWLKNLPAPVREVVSFETSGRVETLGPMADKVMALLLPALPHSNLPVTSDQFQMLLQRIDGLSKQVQVVQLMLDGEGIEDKGVTTVNIGKADSENKRSSQKVVCWYHSVFGERAVACIAPCQFSSANENN